MCVGRSLFLLGTLEETEVKADLCFSLCRSVVRMTLLVDWGSIKMSN